MTFIEDLDYYMKGEAYHKQMSLQKQAEENKFSFLKRISPTKL